jgi:hypothetical protein
MVMVMASVIVQLQTASYVSEVEGQPTVVEDGQEENDIAQEQGQEQEDGFSKVSMVEEQPIVVEDWQGDDDIVP